MRFRLNTVWDCHWKDILSNYEDKLKEFKLIYNENDEYSPLYIEINTLEELIKLRDAVKQEIILEKSVLSDYEEQIEIYDTYRE